MLEKQVEKYNISYIEDIFNQLKISDFKYALVQINIKNFHFYNTRYGIEAGNEILEQVLQKLNSFLEPEEYAGYLYSDNFVLLLRYEDLYVLTRDRLVSLIDSLYRMDNPHIYRNIFFSMGVYELEDSNVTFCDAFNYANLCRKESEDLQKRCSLIEIYDQTFYESYMGRMGLEILTADAFKNYEFVTYLQPKIDLKSGEIVGAEALLRWFDKEGNAIPLYKFLPILNENSYIILIDLDMFDQMCQYLDTRIKNGQKVVPISFNISKSGFYDPSILKSYIDIFEKYNFPIKYVEMEFMESISLNDTAHMKKVISGFKEYGFTCLLDDFGNGYSSFNVLLNAPLDIIKMDRQFFLDNLNGDGRLVVKTIIDLIHSLNMKVVAEGVEQKDHIEYLKSCGCDYVQGYYYYKPIPINEFEAVLDKA